MGAIELFLLAVGLSMDAFAVSICKGLALHRTGIGECAVVGLWFGAFQALMPAIGYFLGSRFSYLIQSFDHWIAFVLLALIGANMIREAFGSEEEECDPSISPRAMLPLAVATSIDALASGIALSAVKSSIATALLLIGITTFCLSSVGVKVGSVFGNRYQRRAEITGGIILIGIGLNILIKHIGSGI